MRAFVLGLVLAIAGCGGRQFQEGYYLAEGDITKVHYPLLIIKYTRDELNAFSASRLAGHALARYKTTDTSTDEVHSGILDAADTFQASFTPEGANIRSKSYSQPKTAPDETDIDLSRAKLLEEKVMHPVSKEEAIKAIRLIAGPHADGRHYGPEQEESCRIAFELSCKQLLKD